MQRIVCFAEQLHIEAIQAINRQLAKEYVHDLQVTCPHCGAITCIATPCPRCGKIS